jgi:NifU-like protein
MSTFSKKILSRFENPLCAGYFTADDAKEKMMRLAVGKEGDIKEGRCVHLFLLVDENDGVIADARFQVFGPPELLAAAESGCELLLRKNTEQARRLTADLLDRHMRDRSDEPAFPESCSWALNLIISAIESAVEQCMDIPIVESYSAPPIEMNQDEQKIYPGWDTLPLQEKIAVIEKVIAEDIRPYVELDAGGVQVINLIDEREVIIAYQGSCTTCYSATGATLNAIQEILRNKVHPSLVVTPDLSLLTTQ